MQVTVCQPGVPVLHRKSAIYARMLFVRIALFFLAFMRHVSIIFVTVLW